MLKKVMGIEKNTDVKIKCYKCGNEYTMGMMRMDPNGKSLVCRSCLDRKPSQRHEQGRAETAKTLKDIDDGMKEYFCKECKYNFKRAARLNVKICPYCNSNSVITKGSTARIMADAFRMKGVD